MTSRETGDAEDGWSAVGERGSALALRFVLSLVRAIGYGPLVVLLAPVSLYFVLFAGSARRASYAYLERIRRLSGEPAQPGLCDVYRHVHMFASVILDRIALWSGGGEGFEIELHGREHMESCVELGQGALLVSAHLGSFDVLRVIARESGISVNVVMYAVNAERINSAFEELDPESRVRLIDLDPSTTRTAFEIRRCLSRGEFVAVMGDRILPGGRERVTRAAFLGEPARFPQSPFLLSTVLGLPIFFVVALRRGARRYDVYIEPIGSGERVPRGEREKVVRERVECYAALLESRCREVPRQWFNFYDFWAEDHEGR